MKQKTVGILTFHRALNYGAVLQAYALKQVCGTLGYDAHIIDYDYDGGAELATPVAAFLAADNKKAALPGLVRGLLSHSGTRKRVQIVYIIHIVNMKRTEPLASKHTYHILGLLTAERGVTDEKI